MFSFYVLLSLEFLDVICICRVALTEIYLGTHPYYCHPSGLTLSPCLALCHIYLRANAFLPRMAEDKYIEELWLLTTSRALETLALHPNILSHAISKQSYISLCLLVAVLRLSHHCRMMTGMVTIHYMQLLPKRKSV